MHLVTMQVMEEIDIWGAFDRVSYGNEECQETVPQNSHLTK